jgi:nucleoside-diphosphate-sugar epimerase
MKVGVTGASGFVGAWVMDMLARRGVVPIPLTRGASTLPDAIAIGDLGALPSPPVLPKLDAVIHLAARTHAMDERDSIEAYRRTNVEGTRQLVEAARVSGAAQFIFMSSIKVNGEHTAPGSRFTEDDEPVPGDAYGISKLEAENVVRSLCERHGIRWTIIRPPLVYGPGVRANFRKLAELSIRGLPLPLGATGNLRSLVHVGNLTEFTVRCLAHPAAYDQLFLISDGEDVSTSELLQRMARSAGRSVRLFPVPRSLIGMAARWTGKSAIFDRLFGNLQLDNAHQLPSAYRPASMCRVTISP